MDIVEHLAPLRPLALIILLALHTKALVLHGPSPSSLNTPRVISRAEQAATLESYTGIGTPPVVQGWQLLTTNLPLQYTPTGSHTTLQLTLKDNKAQNIDPSMIYNLAVLGLADIASSTVTHNGNKNLPRSGQKPSTFATSYPPSNLQFMMTASDDLPVYSVADVLRGMQELTHHLYFLELTFEVFSDISKTSSPLASGCLAFHCGSQDESMNTRDLEFANSSAANASTAPSRQLQQLTTFDELDAVAVTYYDLKSPFPVHDQSFADIATRMLADITNLIIAYHGDGLLPFYGSGNKHLLRYVDTWGSNLTISLLPLNLMRVNFTLGQAAMALKTTQKRLQNGPMMESKLEIMVDDSMVGWGCLSYANASAWRCVMLT
ncbi:hypothetical protein HO173_008700 [Letharia columbiana]|uniref:Uncharacterized protein n=1 Tax=Letharia columbiana TaxID=112416 RepID=A0A8H6L2J7_9LECA|nr:uncharacterized protein HO173_008700 [Letharia columbiana]KAF6233156.1 hypothetical protein HO173_008700 [Letharia columbiana]